MSDGICDTCIHRCYTEAVVRGLMDADPAEEYCEEDMQQFGYAEGCYKYEEVNDA